MFTKEIITIFSASVNIMVMLRILQFATIGFVKFTYLVYDHHDNINIIVINNFRLLFQNNFFSQDIPLDMNVHSTSAGYNYICGRILNICLEYDANCERYLSRAVKLNPTLTDAWYELGECVWKREDFKMAIDCFRVSIVQI